MCDFLMYDLYKKNFRISDFFVTGSRIFMASFLASHTLSVVQMATEKIKSQTEIVNQYPFRGRGIIKFSNNNKRINTQNLLINT